MSAAREAVYLPQIFRPSIDSTSSDRDLQYAKDLLVQELAAVVITAVICWIEQLHSGLNLQRLVYTRTSAAGCANEVTAVPELLS